MRYLLTLAALFLAACAAPPPPPPKVAVDPVTESWYAPAIQELAGLNREAERLAKAGQAHDAAERITKGQALGGKLLAAPRPPLEAMEAASDNESQYAAMLLENKNYGWARLSFQKNVSRWKHWRPQTGDTARRLQEAQNGIAEVDRRMAAQ
ncbi:MAG: hypothetical protein ABI759_14875 [Candidatus Solibacter sp.]